MTLSRGGLICQIYGTTLSNHYQPIRHVSASYIFSVAHFSGIITHNIYLIKGGLICQKNVRTVTLCWGGDLYAGGTYSEGGTYMLVYTVSRV